MIELLNWREKKSNEWRAKQLFALISGLRHTQTPQGEHSSLKLTFALYREGQGDTVYSCFGCQNVFIVSHVFLQCLFGETEC